MVFFKNFLVSGTSSSINISIISMSLYLSTVMILSFPAVYHDEIYTLFPSNIRKLVTYFSYCFNLGLFDNSLPKRTHSPCVASSVIK